MFFTQCPAGCATSLLASDLLLPEGPLLRCPACGHLVSQCDEAAYQKSMERFDRSAEVDKNPRVHLRRMKRMAHYLGERAQGARVLDVGASFGTFLSVLRDHGFQAVGVEPSASAAAESRAKGLDVRHGLLEDAGFSDGSFDAVTLFEVVEHLPEPKPLIENCRKVLKQGGLLILSTGNAESWTARWLKGRWDYLGMHDGGQGHISFFTPTSIRLLLERSGFELVAIETRRLKLFNKRYHPAWQCKLGRVVQELLSLPAKLAGRGHDMLVVARKA